MTHPAVTTSPDEPVASVARLIVHAIEAADLTQGTGLTSPVAAAVGIVTTAILDDIPASRPLTGCRG